MYWRLPVIVGVLAGCTGGSLMFEPTGVDSDTNGTIETSEPSTSEPATTPPETGETGETGDSDTEPVDTGADTVPGFEVDPGICLIDITCDEDAIWDEPKVNCEVSVHDAAGLLLHAGSAGLERRGRSSLDWAKSNYSMEFWSHRSELLIPPGASWRYTSQLSGGWHELGFDDGAWSEGPSPLGWDREDDFVLATELPDDEPITYYFRHTVTLDDPGALDDLWMHVRADDGYIVYVNGVERARANMPAGDPGPTMPATTYRGDQQEVFFKPYRVPVEWLVAGENLVAVELHQGGSGSIDAILDLSLVTDPPNESPDFFDMGGAGSWILSGAYVDLTQYRNVVLYDLYNEMSEANYAPETHYCEVTLNGDWRGLYQLTEKIQRDDDRLDLPEEVGDGTSFVLKNDDADPWMETDFVYGGWQLIYPREADLLEASEASIREFLLGWEQASRTGGDIWQYVDMDSAVDWVLLQEFSRNGDAYWLSIHVARGEGGKLQFVPWDFDIGFGLSCYNYASGAFKGDGGAPDLIGPIKADPVFQQAFRDRWAELRGSILSDEALEQRLDGIEEHFGDVIFENFDRWPEEEIIDGDDWVLDFASDCPTYTWYGSDAVVRDWIFERVTWIDANIDTFPFPSDWE